MDQVNGHQSLGSSEEPDLNVIIRYASTDDDVIAIHQFLLMVAGPNLHAPLNNAKTIREIWRIAREDVALMAVIDNHLVGSLGLVRPTWWYSDDSFLTDRWNHVLPQYRGMGVGAMLEEEALRIADASEVKLLITGKIRKVRKRLTTLPKLYERETDHVLR